MENAICEKVMGTSNHLRGVGVAGSMDMISRSVSFCARLVGRPPKMTLTVFSDLGSCRCLQVPSPCLSCRGGCEVSEFP
jgi:hypothetical protein